MLPGHGTVGQVHKFTLAPSTREGSTLPTASSCGNTLYLPGCLSETDDRRSTALSEAMANRNGFHEGAMAQ